MIKLSPTTWAVIERRWRLGIQTVERIAETFAIEPIAIRNRAAYKKWPLFGSERHDIDLLAQTRCDDLWLELDAAVERLKQDPPETVTEAQDRLKLIRIWRQSMAQLRHRTRGKPAVTAPREATHEQPVPLYQATDESDAIRLVRDYLRETAAPEQP